jgi:hypothetical protein
MTRRSREQHVADFIATASTEHAREVAAYIEDIKAHGRHGAAIDALEEDRVRLREQKEWPGERELMARVQDVARLDVERDAAVAEAAWLRGMGQGLVNGIREWADALGDGPTGAEGSALRVFCDALATPGPGKALLERLERAEAACRAALPHHQGGHSRTGALLRDVVGQDANLIDLDDTKAMQAQCASLKEACGLLRRWRDSPIVLGYGDETYKQTNAFLAAHDKEGA